MSVNDLIVQGAEPLLFLDYYGTSKLDVKVAVDVIKGIADGCILSGCALVGGETAEMPGMYAEGETSSLARRMTKNSHIRPFFVRLLGDYDLVGFALGAVRRAQLLPRPDTMRAGDVLLGLASSGLHSNGFSLVRKIIHRAGLAFSSPCPWTTRDRDRDPSSPVLASAQTVGDALLVPTAIYVQQLLPLCRHRSGSGSGSGSEPEPDSPPLALIKGLAHITGGGFVENVPRVLPEGLAAEIDVAVWELPPVFRWLMTEGNVAPREMARTFNCGIGMVLVVAAEHVDEVVRLLVESKSESGGHGNGAAVLRIGRLVEGRGTQLKGLETWAA